MRAFYKAALLAGAAWSVTAGLAAAQSAPAPKSDAEATVSEVVVTARRREETLKDVPISVTTYSAQKLDKTGVRDITDLQKTTPNMTLTTSRGTNSTLTAFIRGVGQQDPLWGFEPGVGLYVDDVYVARPQAAVLDIFDVQRVEILRGPQGTLYGRNTIGGAIKYVTAPIGKTPELDVRVQGGSYGEHDEIVSGKTPIGQYFGAGFAVAKYDHDGWGENLNTGNDQYDKNVLAARGTLEFTPNEDVFFRLNVDRTLDKSHARHGHREAPYLTFGVPSDPYDTNAGAGDANRVVAEGSSLLGQWKINPQYTLKSITALRRGATDGNIDFDETASPLLDIPARYRDHQFSQELQLQYAGEKLHGVAGVYYLDGTAAGAFDTVLGQFNLTILDAGSVKTRSFSVYGDGSYDVTDKLQVSVGGRWTADNKQASVLRQQYLGIRSPAFGNTAALALGTPNTDYSKEATFKKFTPRVSASYKLSPDLTAYASYGDGFKSGGFDMRGDAKAYPDTVKGFQPETVATFEIGLKGSVLDHKLNFATAIFDSEYKNQQITTQYPNTTAGVASVVDNAGRSRIRGWEGEGSYLIMPGLTANLTLGYVNAEYLEWTAFIPGNPATLNCVTPPTSSAGCYVDVHDQRKFQNTPKWVGAASLNWNVPLGDHGSVTVIPTASYRGAYQMFETPTPLLDQSAYWLYDLDATWTSPSGRYAVGLHGKNLSDERYKTGGYYFPGATFGNSISSFYGAPRTFLISVSAKFY